MPRIKGFLLEEILYILVFTIHLSLIIIYDTIMQSDLINEER